MLRLLLIAGLATTLSAQVVINELQPVPPTGEPEWVELYNPSDTDVALVNLYIYDRTSRASLSGVVVPARGFAILTRDTDDLKLLRRIPGIARLYQVALPTLNNTTESIFLATRDTVVLDSVYYDMRWGIRGRTLERIDPLRPGYLRDNIGACIAPDSATCGYDNSLSLVERDVQVRSLRVDAGRALTIELANRGKTTFEQLPIAFRIRRPTGESWHELGHVTIEYLPPAATSAHTFGLAEVGLTPALGVGEFLLQAIALADDQRKWNDTAIATFFQPLSLQQLVINELMYDPLDGKSEYIELANPSSDTLLLGGLLLGDQLPPQSVLPSIPIPPGGYAVVALDTGIWTTFPELRERSQCVVLRASWSLGNSGDLVVLANPDGSVIDSVRYTPSWHFWGLKDTKGRSLEKLMPSLPSADRLSWSSSTSERGGTPAAPNSILPQEQSLLQLSAAPNPFSPHSTDPRLQQTTITFRLPWQSARVTLRVFDAAGLPVRQLANGMYSGAEGALLWDGRNDAGFAVGAGAYVLLLEATSALSSETLHERAVIIIGK
ncbi:hypothetical protein HRbin20_00476 [bacterium HR20]|nr:hypothetical protein HRbin20_00476 [bacterium HR20]